MYRSSKGSNGRVLPVQTSHRRTETRWSAQPLWIGTRQWRSRLESPAQTHTESHGQKGATSLSDEEELEPWWYRFLSLSACLSNPLVLALSLAASLVLLVVESWWSLVSMVSMVLGFSFTRQGRSLAWLTPQTIPFSRFRSTEMHQSLSSSSSSSSLAVDPSRSETSVEKSNHSRIKSKPTLCSPEIWSSEHL